MTVDLSNVTSNTGFQFDGYNFRVIDPDASAPGTVQHTLIKGKSSSGYTYNFGYNFDGTNLTFTAYSNGAQWNGISIIDGYSYTEDDPSNMITYTAYSALDSAAISTVQTAADGEAASYEFELENMTIEDFSDKYSGKLLTIEKRTSYGSTTSTTSTTYKFYDSNKAPKLESFDENKDKGTRNDGIYRRSIDIDDIRNAVVNGGQTLAQAVQAKLGGTVDGDNLKFTSSVFVGAEGNNDTVTLTEETLRHYDIDFSKLSVAIPEGLYGKGFRVYCATDNKEWFNFVFTDGTDSYNIDKDNIKNVDIDVSAVTDNRQLLQTIIDQANPILTGDDLKFNHHMRLAADLDKKILTIYDHRRFDVSKPPYDYQENGAKIADGVAFKEDYVIPKRNFSVKDLVIQHTDKANMNIHIKIPQMTLDHIFDPLPDYGATIFDYPVTDKDSRDALLGKPIPPGILDTGLQYLLDAATMVGAQNRRLEFTAENITTETENLTASESTISDADMAKEMTAYTKANILAQASQAVLAQANQNHSMILSLLE